MQDKKNYNFNANVLLVKLTEGKYECNTVVQRVQIEVNNYCGSWYIS